MHSCESDGQHQETGDKCPNPISKRNRCWQANQSAGRCGRSCSQETSRSSPSIQMCVPPGWSRCRSQVAHPFPSTTSCSKRAGSPGLAAWQQPFVKFSYSQIHIASSDPQRATNPPSVHPATQVYHQPLLLSPTADSPCSFSPAAQRFQEKRTATRCACNADGTQRGSSGSSSTVYQVTFLLHHTILKPIDLKWNSAGNNRQLKGGAYTGEK